MKIGFLHTIIRKEEKLLLKELQSRNNVEVDMIDARKLAFYFGENGNSYDAVLDRCVSHSFSLHALRLFQSAGIKCINNYQVVMVCGDKLWTSAALQDNGIPQPKTGIAFTEQAAIEAIEKIGYPVVMKPAVGSWGRLLSKINDRDAAETVLEHKTTLGSFHHSIFYIQQYIPKNGRDIRAYVVGDTCIGAIFRNNEHWKTNIATGGKATNCTVTPELHDLAVRAARAVGGGIVGVDLFESENGLLVNEVNDTMEFNDSATITGVNIPARIIDYVLVKAIEDKYGKN